MLLLFAVVVCNHRIYSNISILCLLVPWHVCVAIGINGSNVWCVCVCVHESRGAKIPLNSFTSVHTNHLRSDTHQPAPRAEQNHFSALQTLMHTCMLCALLWLFVSTVLWLRFNEVVVVLRCSADSTFRRRYRQPFASARACTKELFVEQDAANRFWSVCIYKWCTFIVGLNVSVAFLMLGFGRHRCRSNWTLCRLFRCSARRRRFLTKRFINIFRQWGR